MSGQPEFEHRGKRYRLTREYAEYDDLKNDPHNFDQAENARLAAAIEEAELVTSFASRDEALRYLFSLPFPGSGMTQLGIPRDWVDRLLAFTIKVPRKPRERVLVYASNGKGWSLVCDFLAKADPKIVQLIPRDDEFDFCGLTGSCIVARPRSDATPRGRSNG